MNRIFTFFNLSKHLTEKAFFGYLFLLKKQIHKIEQIKTLKNNNNDPIIIITSPFI